MAKLHMLKSVTDTINTSFIVQDENSLIVFDGGFQSEAEYLHDYLSALGGVVNGWFLTHMHSDHVGAIIKILNDYPDITIEKIYCNFPSDEYLAQYEPNTSPNSTLYYSSLFRNTVSDKKVCQITVNENEVFNFSGISVRVLLTHEGASGSVNNSSTVFSVEVNGKRILFLGDLGVSGGNRLLRKNDHSMLRSDYVQMAHHGQDGVDKNVYEAIHPRFCCWCTPSWLWDNLGPNGYDTGVYKTIIVRGWISSLRCVEKHYVMTEGTHTIEL
ncbi:MAG: MBL fold metallo-hydrolase [Ruminococcaceae bacterium]|nr:MBL fold metallo-hydrolase [Oscillospiraceae bacterium]